MEGSSLHHQCSFLVMLGFGFSQQIDGGAPFEILAFHAKVRYKGHGFCRSLGSYAECLSLGNDFDQT